MKYTQQVTLIILVAWVVLFLALCGARMVTVAQTSSPTSLVSVNNAGTASGNSGSYAIAMTPDARYVLFESYASDLLAGGDAKPDALYLRDVIAGTTRMVDVN